MKPEQALAKVARQLLGWSTLDLSSRLTASPGPECYARWEAGADAYGGFTDQVVAVLQAGAAERRHEAAGRIESVTCRCTAPCACFNPRYSSR